MKKSLAFDFGATSIRGILGYVEDGKLVCEEVMRLSHNRIDEDGRSRWDFDVIVGAIKSTILEFGEDISSIGVNTWGVDFGIIDCNGDLLEKPVSYRDDRHFEGFEAAQESLSAEEIFMATGNQLMSINTLYQLLVLKADDINYKKIDKVLMLPDLFNYLLTSEVYGEMTIASTSQLFDLSTLDYSKKILDTYNLDPNMFPKIISQGKIIGSTKNSRIKALTRFDIPVISVASHDTASAVLMTSAYANRNTIFLSSGTWSLIGCISDKAVINQEAFDKSLTNECGVNGTNMFFKNITGLYIIEKLKDQLEQKLGRSIEFSEITVEVEKSTVTDIVNVEAAVFQRNEFDAIEAINEALGKSFDNDFDYFKVIYLSLAHKYKEIIGYISQIESRKFDKIHCIGGGAKSSLLCQLISDVCNMEVITGPYEATAYGNILIQQVALGVAGDLSEAVNKVKDSFELKHYFPR